MYDIVIRSLTHPTMSFNSWTSVDWLGSSATCTSSQSVTCQKDGSNAWASPIENVGPVTLCFCDILPTSTRQVFCMLSIRQWIGSFHNLWIDKHWLDGSFNYSWVYYSITIKHYYTHRLITIYIVYYKYCTIDGHIII